MHLPSDIPFVGCMDPYHDYGSISQSIRLNDEEIIHRQHRLNMYLCAPSALIIRYARPGSLISSPLERTKATGNQRRGQERCLYESWSGRMRPRRLHSASGCGGYGPRGCCRSRGELPGRSQLHPRLPKGPRAEACCPRRLPVLLLLLLLTMLLLLEQRGH